jgi:hypothetical protein
VDEAAVGDRGGEGCSREIAAQHETGFTQIETNGMAAPEGAAILFRYCLR